MSFRLRRTGHPVVMLVHGVTRIVKTGEVVERLRMPEDPDGWQVIQQPRLYASGRAHRRGRVADDRIEPDGTPDG